MLIGRLAIDDRYANRGLGRSLIRDAFERIVESADIVGTRTVMVQAKTCEAADFYRKLGFQPSDSHPALFFHFLKDIKKSLVVTGKQ